MGGKKKAHFVEFIFADRYFNIVLGANSQGLIRH